MKKIFFLLSFFIAQHTYSQIDISVGMGINFVNSPSIQDYVNTNFKTANNDLKTFNSTIDFFLEADYSISENYQIGFEHDISLFAFSAPLAAFSNYNLDYTMQRPSVLLYYLILGNGYKLKFGGGVGPRFVTLKESKGFINADDYTSTGFGILLKAQGHTSLGGNFYAIIGGDLRYDTLSELENSNFKLENRSLNEFVNLNSFSIGVKLGISYFL